MSSNPYSSGRWSRNASLSNDIIIGNVDRFTKGKLVQCEEMVSHSTIPIPEAPSDQAVLFLQTLFEPDDQVNIVSGWAGRDRSDGRC